jgi:hypothetical protein
MRSSPPAPCISFVRSRPPSRQRANSPAGDHTYVGYGYLAPPPYNHQLHRHTEHHPRSPCRIQVDVCVVFGTDGLLTLRSVVTA